MQPYRPISSYLPMTFKNNTRVQKFAKQCPQCGTVVDAQQMLGAAVMMDDMIILAAEGLCPQCKHRFKVACIIDSQKKVQKIWLPLFFLRWYLAAELKKRPPQAMPAELADTEPTPPPAKPALPEGQAIGRYQGFDITPFVWVEGQRYAYKATAPQGLKTVLKEDEYLYQECLIYQKEAAQ